MNWVKLHNGFPDHPKVALAGWKAAWLYVCGLTYCSRYLTDGLIPKAQVKRLTDMPKAEVEAARLVTVGLWLEHDQHYEVHDYLAFQTSAEKVEAEREAGRKRAAASAAARAKKPRSFATSSGEDAQPDSDVDVDTSSSSGTDSPTTLLGGVEEEEEPDITEAQQAELDRRWANRNSPDCIAKYGPVGNPFGWRMKTLTDILEHYAEGDSETAPSPEPQRPYDRAACPNDNCAGGWLDAEAGVRCPDCSPQRASA